MQKKMINKYILIFIILLVSIFWIFDQKNTYTPDKYFFDHKSKFIHIKNIIINNNLNGWLSIDSKVRGEWHTYSSSWSLWNCLNIDCSNLKILMSDLWISYISSKNNNIEFFTSNILFNNKSYYIYYSSWFYEWKQQLELLYWNNMYRIIEIFNSNWWFLSDCYNCWWWGWD